MVRLLVQLVFADQEETLRANKDGALVNIYDPACGTGGMMTEAKEYLTQAWGLDPSNVSIFGQELREKTYAICKADALMKGDDGSRIKRGNTLSEDKLEGYQFKFMLANPEFGTDWKKIEDRIRAEAERGFDGRFGAGLPEVGDASFLFLQHMIAKMTAPNQGGSVIGIVFNGSPLFNGDAGSGWSNIRKWIIQNDWLDAIVALPEDMFYNTNIATYLWIVRNNKPQRRKGRIILVNGNQERFRNLMRRNLGKKRVELTPATIAELVRVYREGQPVPKLAQVFDLEDFGYTRVVVERPLRLRFEIDAERLQNFRQSSYYTGLILTKKIGLKAEADIAKGKEKQAALLAALEQAKTLLPCRDDRVFMQFVNNALPFKATGQLIAALRSVFGEAGEDGEKVLLKPLEAEFDRDKAEADPGAWYQPDSNLRDQERIPLKTDIETYFAEEVLPYAPDAWMNRAKDEIGYEISFTKYFYEYKPPRALEDIITDLEFLRRQIDLLQEQRTAVIHHAVTKGLDPAAKMKPSGVEWLGNVPEEWNVLRLRFCCSIRGGIGFPDKFQGSTIGDYPFLKNSDINSPDNFVSTAENYVDKSLALIQGWHPIPANSLIMGKSGEALRKNHRAVCLVDCLIDNNLMALIPKPKLFDMRFFFYLFSLIDMDWFTNPGTVPSVSVRRFVDFRLIVPPLEEQREIISFLDQETAKLDTIISKYRRELELLAEYRASLISHAVTGRIDVRGLAELESNSADETL